MDPHPADSTFACLTRADSVECWQSLEIRHPFDNDSLNNSRLYECPPSRTFSELQNALYNII